MTTTIVFISNVRFNNYIRQIALLVVLFKTLSICNSPLLFFSFRYTSKPDAVYAILLEWPLTSELTLGAPISTSGTQVTMLGYEGEFNWKPATEKGGMIVTFPSIPVSKLPCQWAWALKLGNVK